MKEEVILRQLEREYEPLSLSEIQVILDDGDAWGRKLETLIWFYLKGRIKEKLRPTKTFRFVSKDPEGV